MEVIFTNLSLQHNGGKDYKPYPQQPPPVAMCGQAMYIVTLGEHIGSGKAYWASTFTHWVSALGLHNASGKA